MLLETIPGVLLEAFCQGKLFYRFCAASMIRVSNLRSLAAIIKGVLIFILKIVSWCYTSFGHDNCVHESPSEVGTAYHLDMSVFLKNFTF